MVQPGCVLEEGAVLEHSAVAPEAMHAASCTLYSGQIACLAQLIVMPAMMASFLRNCLTLHALLLEFSLDLYLHRCAVPFALRAKCLGGCCCREPSTGLRHPSSTLAGHGTSGCQGAC